MKILKEEVDNRISKEDYLNKILDYLVEDTIIDFEEGEIYFPPFPFLPSSPYPPSSPIDMIPPGRYLVPSFSKYCKDNYGLIDEEIYYLLEKYTEIISDKINDDFNIMESINESVDNKKRYLDKVVDFLVDDTTIDFKYSVIKFPSSPFLLFPRSPSPPVSLSFSKYCRDNYGLTDEEIDYVWDTYKNIILDKFDNSGNINESVDNRISREDYLNKILDYLVEDTIIDYDENEIRSPYTSSLHPLFSPLSTLSSLPFFFFYEYCKETYGLTDEEIDYVWDTYKNIILDKFDNS
jgi:hypothetical protein